MLLPIFLNSYASIYGEITLNNYPIICYIITSCSLCSFCRLNGFKVQTWFVKLWYYILNWKNSWNSERMVDISDLKIINWKRVWSCSSTQNYPKLTQPKLSLLNPWGA